MTLSDSQSTNRNVSVLLNNVGLLRSLLLILLATLKQWLCPVVAIQSIGLVANLNILSEFLHFAESVFMFLVILACRGEGLAPIAHEEVNDSK